MIYFDVTKTGRAAHRSGLTRVSARLRDELADAAIEVRWPEFGQQPRPTDWFLTAELFSEFERPGFTAFLDARRCRLAAIFHDAIPLKHPHITWPQSVERHPSYLKLLAKFDRVWAVSAASKQELEGFWRWQGLTRVPPVEVLMLGADFKTVPRNTVRPMPATKPAKLLSVGIIEPRKNQQLLLDVCAELWSEGLAFELHLVGRTNPHFGVPIVARARKLAKEFPGVVVLHDGASDAKLAELHADARATVFPTIAEGCGLPLLESLWLGVPCVCSDLPVLRENADAGGCLPVPVNDATAWRAALRRALTDDPLIARLSTEATTRSLPTWAESARILRNAISG